MNQIELYMIAVMFVVLFLATFFDMVWKHYVPVAIPAAGIMIRLIELGVCEDYKMKEMIFIAVLMFIMLFIMAYLGNLGGADCLIGAMCGLYIGIYALYGMIIAFALAIPYTLQMKVKEEEKEYAFIPYILIGMLVVMLIKKGEII